jgi:SAM-dependent methyltransferase
MRVRVRLCRRRTVNPSLPSRQLLQLQSDWLADARSRMFRLAEIGQKKAVLDLGAGYGIVTQELRRRTSGKVVALDRSLEVLRATPTYAICADASHPPFRSQTFDLVFTQNVLLWIRPIGRLIENIRKILISSGVWVLFEPDYGGMMEYPTEIETASIWIEALTRAGADPFVGRKLPSLLSCAGFKVRCELLQQPGTPNPERFKFLSELSLTAEEQRKLHCAKAYSEKLLPSQQIAHLPYFMIIAVCG